MGGDAHAQVRAEMPKFKPGRAIVILVTVLTRSPHLQGAHGTVMSPVLLQWSHDIYT